MAVDFVYGFSSTTEYVYRTIAEPIINGLFDGLNGTILAYGQTGSGKTHTTIGYPPRHPGMIFLSAQHVFTTIKKMKTTDPGGVVEMKVSYLQIYCETMQDLLVDPADSKKQTELKIRMHPEQGLYVEGLSEMKLSKPDDLMPICDLGTKRRAVPMLGTGAG